MNCANQTHEVIENGFTAIRSYFPPDSANPIMTDIIMQVNNETGALTIYDDDDNEIFSEVVEEWIGNEAEDFYPTIEALLREHIRHHAGEIKELAILKPYSFVLVDDDKETVCELYLVDDDTIVIDSTQLMQNLDKDLDDFFDKLMKD